MQEPKRQSSPFKVLGKQLRFLRENHQESLDEVSGAVEIETELLERIERGEERPTEDILVLLINHFGMADHEADILWDSAGYERAPEPRLHIPHEPPTKTLVLLALDLRVLYSDSAVISQNDSGLVINFMQTSQQSLTASPIARIGMSYEQVEKVADLLQQALLRHKYLPKQYLLPPGSTNS